MKATTIFAMVNDINKIILRSDNKNYFTAFAKKLTMTMMWHGATSAFYNMGRQAYYCYFTLEKSKCSFFVDVIFFKNLIIPYK